MTQMLRNNKRPTGERMCRKPIVSLSAYMYILVRESIYLMLGMSKTRSYLDMVY